MTTPAHVFFSAQWWIWDLKGPPPCAAPSRLFEQDRKWQVELFFPGDPPWFGGNMASQNDQKDPVT